MPGKGKPWSKEDEDKLRERYATVRSLRDLAAELGRSYPAVKSRARVLGLSRDYGAAVWPPEREARLIELYPDHTNAEIARLLDCPETTVNAKAYVLGLRKSPEWAREKSKAGWFKKGQEPRNKGKKWDEFMSKEGQERSRRTCFQQGHSPHNHKPVGYERKTRDGYWEVKVSEPNKFKAKHRLLWEKHHGEIPKGVNIVFIDGNPDHIAIENLRAETMREKFDRCCCIHTRFPKEVCELVQLKGALQRQLNKAAGEKPKKNKNRRKNKDNEE